MHFIREKGFEREQKFGLISEHVFALLRKCSGKGKMEVMVRDLIHMEVMDDDRLMDFELNSTLRSLSAKLKTHPVALCCMS